MSRKPFPESHTLKTERLLLRPLRADDVPVLSALRSDPQVNAYLARDPVCTAEAAEAFIQKTLKGREEGEMLYFAIQLHDEPRLIGTCCLFNFINEDLEGEVGYELSPTYQGRGIMREALGALIRLGFQTLGLERVCAFTQKGNASSEALLKHFGFQIDPSRIDPHNPKNRIWVLAKV